MSCYIQLFPNPIRAKTPTVPRGHLVSCAMVLMEGTTIEGDESLRLTRSSTVFHSLLRVFGSGKIPSHLTLHVVGADHREGSTPEQTRAVFSNLLDRLCGDENVWDLDILFCGPNIAAGLHGAHHCFSHRAPIEVAQSSTTVHNNGDNGTVVDDAGDEPPSATNPCCPASTEMTVTFRYDAGLYHEGCGIFVAPNAMFLFNAGLWGYDDWLPTLEHIFGCGADYSADVGSRVDTSGPSGQATRPMKNTLLAGIVVTSYCAEEAEDDMDTVERVLVQLEGRCKCVGPSTNSGAETETAEGGKATIAAGALLDRSVDWLWKPETNPHRSLVPRRTACGVEGRVLFENHSWQAIRLPRHV